MKDLIATIGLAVLIMLAIAYGSYTNQIHLEQQAFEHGMDSRVAGLEAAANPYTTERWRLKWLEGFTARIAERTEFGTGDTSYVLAEEAESLIREHYDAPENNVLAQFRLGNSVECGQYSYRLVK